MWRKAMLYLGLGPDEEYEDGTASAGGPPPAAAPARRAPAPEQAAAPPQRRPSAASAGGAGASVRQLPTQQPAKQVAPGARPSSVRPVRPAPAAKPVVIAPASFNQAQEVADHFRDSQPVIMNLQGLSRELSRRLIDFASGVCYGLGGQMERVAVDVFLLTPSKMEVSKEERRRLQQRGLHDS